MTMCSHTRLRAIDVPAGAVVAAEIDDDEIVVWRGRSGELCAMPRQCPHLDWDLADATVFGDELVCSGHGWAFDCDGHAFKRNLQGRLDPKDDVATLPVEEVDGEIRVSPRTQ
ncbi:MAG: (2Fe-2S)-binding protein [Actinomycetia bacterium]|jgi:phenylpropionate dioxygenase-like ring-hydroxylating dioxygenase large terminal subunit|nr:(2Fe-2S)-binding protein [Actinomycetes bacterium]